MKCKDCKKMATRSSKYGVFCEEHWYEHGMDGTSLASEIAIAREKIGEIKSILFGGDENVKRAETLYLVETLIDDMRNINQNLVDIRKAVGQLK